MVSINLLKGQQHYEHRVRSRSKSELSAGVVVLAGVCAVWGWAIVNGNLAVQRLEQEIQEKQARVALLQKAHHKVLKLKERRQVIVTEHNKLKALTNDLAQPTRLLSIISQVVDPLDVWLLHLQAKDEKIILTGFARSLEDILKLSKDFEKTDMLGPVNVFETQAHVGQSNLFQFSMNVFMDSTDHVRKNS